ncbi:unnamed protein product, partial [Lampetra fluviatilis]
GPTPDRLGPQPACGVRRAPPLRQPRGRLGPLRRPRRSGAGGGHRRGRRLRRDGHPAPHHGRQPPGLLVPAEADAEEEARGPPERGPSSGRAAGAAAAAGGRLGRGERRKPAAAAWQASLSLRTRVSLSSSSSSLISSPTPPPPPLPCPLASIERIERKNLSKRKGERCTEYYLEVFWSDGSTVSLSKTYQELHDFLSKLPQIFPNDHLERLFPPPPARGATAFSTHRTDSSTERQLLASAPAHVLRSVHVRGFLHGGSLARAHHHHRGSGGIREWVGSPPPLLAPSLPGGPTASPDHVSVGRGSSPQLVLASLPPASPTSRHGDAAPGPHGSEVVGVLDWLKKLRLHKYYPEFKHLSMEQFLNLSEEDVDMFENLTEGAKKKLRTQLAKERAEKFGGVSESYPLSNGVTRVPSSHHSPTHNSRHNPAHNAQRSPSINSSRTSQAVILLPSSSLSSSSSCERGARDGSAKEKPPTFPSHPINQAICIMRPTAQVTPVQNPSVHPPLLVPHSAPHSTPFSACPSSLSLSHLGSHPGSAHAVGRRKENAGGLPLPPELPGADGPAHGTGEIRLGGGGGGGRFISASPLVHLGSPALPSGFASRGKATVTAFGNSGAGSSGGSSSSNSSSNSISSNSSRSSMESPEMSRLLPQPVPVQVSRQDDSGGPGSPYIFTGGGHPQHQQQQHGKTSLHEHPAPATQQQQHAPQQAPPLHLYAVESDAFPPSGKHSLAGAKPPTLEAPAVMPGGVLAGGYCTTRGAFPAHGAGAGSGGGVLLAPVYNGGGGSEAELNGTGLGAPSHQHQQQHQQSCCSSCSSCGCSGGCGGTRGLPLSYPYFQPFSTPFIGFPVIPMSSAMYGSFPMAQQPTVGGHANQAAAAFYIPSPAPFPGHEPGSLGALTGMALPYQRAVSDAYLFHQHHHGQNHVVQQQQQQHQQQQHVQPALHYQYSVGPRRHGGLPTLSCYNCGACGHRASECKHPTMDTNQQGTFRLKYAPSSENVDSSD